MFYLKQQWRTIMSMMMSFEDEAAAWCDDGSVMVMALIECMNEYGTSLPKCHNYEDMKMSHEDDSAEDDSTVDNIAADDSAVGRKK